MLSTAKSLADIMKSTHFKFPIAQARSLYCDSHSVRDTDGSAKKDSMLSLQLSID